MGLFASLRSAMAVRQKDGGYRVHPEWTGPSSRDGNLLLHSFEGDTVFVCFMFVWVVECFSQVKRLNTTFQLNVVDYIGDCKGILPAELKNVQSRRIKAAFLCLVLFMCEYIHSVLLIKLKVPNGGNFAFNPALNCARLLVMLKFSNELVWFAV